MAKKNIINKIILIFWALFVLGIGGVSLTFYLVAKGKIGYMPRIEDLENPIDKYASQIISSDNVLLGTYAQSRDNRIFVSYNDLSPHLVNALIATEDIRYRNHSGIDAYALARAVIKRGLLFQKNAGGGSTITQQLAKLLYSPGAENVIERLLQKPIEWVIAVQLERTYTKDEIINLYLNKFDFLYNAVGIQSAAKVYFNKSPKALTIEEAATLIGMLKNPSYFNPIRRDEATKSRRNVVLRQMYKADYLTKTEFDSLSTLPIKLNFQRVDHKEGLAPYFREYLRMAMTAKKPDKSDYASWQQQKYSDDSLAWATNPLYGWCNKNKKSDGSKYDLYTDGLKIYATINSHMQKYAEDAVVEHLSKDLQPKFDKEKKGRSYAPYSRDLTTSMVDTLIIRSMRQSDRYRALKKEGLSNAEILKNFKTPIEMKIFSWSGMRDTVMSPWDSIRHQKSFLRAGFMSMDAVTGHVKAYVGGINYFFFQYDMINSGRRQVGSTIKPFLYTLAMEDGFTPCDMVLNDKQQLITETGVPWEPRNANDNRRGEMVTLKWGLQNSNNWISAYLMKHLSPYSFVRLLHSFGLQNQIDPVVSLCLGICDASIGEMVSGYTAFARNGIRVSPLYVTRVEDAYGNTIATFSPEMNEVFSEESSYKMLDMLQAVVDGGTGSRVRFRYNIKAPMGAKTGTTQNHSDGWFMGFTPSLVSGCWVGGEERSIHFDRITEGQGASMALPIYGLFMQKVYGDKSLGYTQEEIFEVPDRYKNPCATSAEDEIMSGLQGAGTSNSQSEDVFDW